MSSRTILVTGATGKQGGALIDNLLSSENTGITILAVTRNPQSPAAKKLTDRGVKVIKGDLNDVPAIFEAAKKELGDQDIWGVYSLQISQGRGASIESEESQGRAMVDNAISNGVKYFVYASGDRGGEKSFETPTTVLHWASKYRVEHYLVDNAKGKMEWCILRPTGFMENVSADFFGKVMCTCWKIAGQNARMQWISVKDIGFFAAQVFLHPEQYAGHGISLAGDELTWAEGNEIFKRVVGKEFPLTFELVGKALLFMISDIKNMFNWLSEHPSGADIPELKKTHPGLMSFEQWLKQESAWKKTE